MTLYHKIIYIALCIATSCVPIFSMDTIPDYIRVPISRERLDRFLQEKLSDQERQFQAACSGDIIAVDNLFKSPVVSVNYQLNTGISSLDGYTPMHIAAQNGHTNVLVYMAQVPYADPNLKSAYGGYTPLHLAAVNGDIDAVQALLAIRGVDIYVQDYMGRTAADLADIQEHYTVCALLQRKHEEQQCQCSIM